jgi:hypothetical protein
MEPASPAGLSRSLAGGADREVQAIVRSFHVGAEPPLVTHLIAAQPSDDD